MKLVIFNIFVCFCFVSCSNCKEDAEFKMQFENNILFIQRTQYECDTTKCGGYESSTWERANSINCMYALTGYLGYVDIGNEPHYLYPDIDSVPVDIRIWRKWYDDNKCGFTMQMADSIFKNFERRNATTPLQWSKCVDSIKFVELPCDLFE